ncbi:hypothetical protein [Ruminococcus sp. FC2018]|uniref:hypothetical protein n=1 Tax=Ruminococcus sp. FC2018 TaxID=1410617 RepID=UPI000491DA10|nr:hypothetical protein [Ruminococcus sp. FC2018]
MEYVIVGAIVGAFIGVVFVLAKKQNANDEAIAAALPEEVKNYLMQTPMQPVDGVPDGAAVVGYIYNVRKQNASNVWFTIMYYNQYFPNLRDKIISADIKTSIAEAQAHNLGPNMYVWILFNQDKTPQLIYQQ